MNVEMYMMTIGGDLNTLVSIINHLTVFGLSFPFDDSFSFSIEISLVELKGLNKTVNVENNAIWDPKSKNTVFQEKIVSNFSMIIGEIQPPISIPLKAILEDT